MVEEVWLHTNIIRNYIGTKSHYHARHDWYARQMAISRVTKKLYIGYIQVFGNYEGERDLLLSGTRHRAIWWKFTDISENRA